MPPIFKKSAVALTIGCFVLLAATLLMPGSAKAEFGAPQPVITLQDYAAMQAKAVASAKTAILNSTKYAITSAILTAVDTAAQRVAANAATFIVSGGKGKTPLAYITEWKSWHDNILMDSVSDSINTLSNKYLGFGICAPLNTQLDLRIKLGIAQLYAPRPNCTFNQAWNAVLADKNNISSGKILSTVTLSFQMGASPLSIAMNTQYAVVNKALKAAADDINQRITSPYKPLTDLISGNVKTPAKMIEDTALTPIKTINQAEAAKKNVEINNIDLLAAVGANALKVFTSTLASKAIDKYLKGGTLTGKDILCASSAGKSFDLCKGVINSTADAGAVSGSTDTALASAYFASLFTPSVGQIDDYSPINDLSACPTDPTARGIWNCAMDQGFVKALSADENGHLSVAEAIAAGDLNGGWYLIPPNDNRNISPTCWDSNYCYTNLVKLRRMRIIPVGWEMAAKAAADSVNFPSGLTLQAAVAAFNDCAADSNGGHLDATHPLCHLVDPDWILKVPVTQCKAQASGQTLAAPNTSERADVCVDSPSCVSEDADGKCTGGYGYCTREQNVWRIDATACPAQYASCDTFSDPNGKDLSVLKNTVDVAACSAQNAGCRPYAAVPGASGWADGQPSVFLTSQAPECDAKSAGCRALSDLKTATTANLIPNPSFETPRADGAMAAGWHDMTGQYVQDGIFSFDGVSAYHIEAPANGAGLKLGGYNDNVPTDPDHYAEVQVQPQSLYTLSFYAKGGATVSGELIMKAFDAPFYGTKHDCPDGTPNLSTCLQDMTRDIGYSPTCTTTATKKITCTIVENFDNGQTVAASALELDFPLSAGYERQTMTFATSSDTHYLSFDFGWGDYYIDAVQLEAGATATPFHTGGSDMAGQTVNIKVPPAYLGCTGEDSDAGKGCSAYAPVCRQSEVGCDEFTPSNAGMPITAVASGNDACNAECVGYSTFKQEPTLWASEQFPLYFIPSTAKSCDLSEVGCDEFTNLAAAAAGGESKAYYTSIRACRAPDAASDGNYFTWEGSDASGYQLRSYVLVNKAASDGTMEAVPNATGGANGTTFVQKTDPNADPNPPGPVYLTGTVISQCNQDVYNGANGAIKNPDCRELIDANGNIFYRLLSATIAADAACQTFRKTLSKQSDCQGSGGVWNATAAACDYFVLASESNSCPAEANGCRAYDGNQGNNVQNIFLSDFENGQLDAWTGGAPSTESTVAGEHSYAAVTAQKPLAYPNGNPLLVQGRSYTLTVWAKGTGTLTASFEGKNIGQDDRSKYFADPNNSITLGSEWQRYQLGPVIVNWAPDSGDVLQVGSIGGKGFFDNIELDATQGVFALVAGSWKTPAVCDETSAGQALPQAQLGCSEYSSKTSGAAVDLKSFDHLCRAQAVGCAAFTDTQGTDTPFASFKNALCGINIAIDKNNSNDCLFNGKKVCSAPPGTASCRFDFDGSEDQLGATPTPGYTTSVVDDTFIVPPDTTEYLVNDGTFSCDASEVGCTALGDNDINTLGTCSLGNDASGNPRKAATVEWCQVGVAQCYVSPGQTSCSYRIPMKVNGNTVYRTLDPANLSGELCTQDAVSCTEWTTTSGDKTYFKDPGAALCEYKDTATLNGNTVSGWFKKGTAEPCDPKFIANGNALGIRRNLDPEFAPNNFAGVCPTEQSACTEFTDHSDLGADLKDATGKVIGHEFSTGRPFYYINDSKITDASAACNGQVSKKQGCLLLDQTDNPQKLFDTAASYLSSDTQGFKMVDPISNPGSTTPPVPSTNDANILLKVTRDRVCSEWLECNTDQTTADPATGRDVTRCLSLGSCLKKGADGRCAQWGQLDPNAKALTSALYASRDVTSAGSDYSGFSIPNQPPVALYKQSGSTPYTLNTLQNAPIAQSCKEYPEADAPFPKTVLTDQTGSTSGPRVSGFNNANVCEYSAGDNQYLPTDCECSYRKAAYGTGITKYFPPNAETGTRADGSAGEIKGAICSGGLYDGEECWPLATGDRIDNNDPQGRSANLSCENGSANGGSCEPLSKVDSLIGEEGYCLEHDDTFRVNGSDEKACITWLPVDSTQGRDTANQFTSAAFIPKIGQERYCAAPAKYCVAHDCANPPEIPAICTALHSYTVGVGGPLDGCFLSCNGGGNASDACKAAVKPCVSLINTYCAAIGSENCVAKVITDPSCRNYVEADPTTWGNDNYCGKIIDQCFKQQEAGADFCKSMNDKGCLTGDIFATNWQCTGDINDSYYAVDRLAGKVGSPINGIFAANPSFNVDSFCGFDVGDPTHWNNGLNACAQDDRQFCGNGESCPSGTQCTDMNDLSVHQTEYTKEEDNEGYCASTGNPLSGNYGSCDPNTDALTVYQTKPALGAHTFFGASNADANGQYIPMLSSNSLEFKIADQSGDWINIYNQAFVQKDENSYNFSPETKAKTPIIGSYPQDFVGLYYYGNPTTSGNASVTYDLTNPPLLLTSQIDRITVKILSNYTNGLCQYGSNTNGAKTGECFNLNLQNLAGTGTVYFAKEIFTENHPDGSSSGYVSDYGYEPPNMLLDDGEKFSTDKRPSFIVLTEGNNWTQELNSGQGNMVLTLLISDDEPKRVTGIRVDLLDNNQRGFMYIAGLDVHLRGPVCGAATYVGSSNPAADSKSWPVVDTNHVNNATDYPPVLSPGLLDALQTPLNYGAACSPWGAFTATNPPSFVTDSQAPLLSGQCELNKGAVYPGDAQQQTIFGRAVGINMFDGLKGDFIDKPIPAYTSLTAWPTPTVNPSLPQVSSAICTDNSDSCKTGTVGSTMSVNNVDTGAVTGVGSLRANLKFYATADPNRMPIRSVKINWGDKTDFVDPGVQNYYKNHDGGSVTANGVTIADCSNNKSFIQTPGACDTKPFAYSHVYSCNIGATNNTADKDYPNLGLVKGKPDCVYTPTVSVTDNWGATVLPVPISANVGSTVKVILAPAQ
jgi:hypothetical protein